MWFNYIDQVQYVSKSGLQYLAWSINLKQNLEIRIIPVKIYLYTQTIKKHRHDQFVTQPKKINKSSSKK